MRLLGVVLLIAFGLLAAGAVGPPVVVRTGPGDSFIKRVFSTDDGLPQNTATDLVQTRDGFVWIATYGGLARFDGLTFKVFTTSNSPALVNNRLMALAEGPDGILWIGSEDGDLMKYESGRFSVAWKSRGEPFDSVLRDIYIDSAGIVWLGTDLGLKSFDPVTNKFDEISTETIIGVPTYAGKELSIRRFATDRLGRLWIATSAGLVLMENGAFRHFENVPRLPRDDMWFLMSNPFGDVFLSFEEKLVTFDGVTANFPATIPIKEPPPASAGNARTVFVHGHTLYNSTAAGLEAYAFPDALPPGEIRSTLFDREGNLWMGTQFNLIQHRKRRVRTFVLRTADVDEPTTSMIETPDGAVWVVSRTRLLRFDANADAEPKIFELEEKNLISLAVEPATGTLWIGAEDAILKYEGGKFVRFEGADIKGSSDLTLFFDDENTLWIGTKNQGLKTYRDGVTRSYSTADGLVSNTISRVYKDRSGVVWIGSKSGLSQFKDGRFTNFSTENGLTNNYVRDFYEDADGNMWIGTYGGGLLHYRDGRFTPITVSDGLTESVVSRILVDSSDNFWIMGNRGVFSVKRSVLLAFVNKSVTRVFCDQYGKPDGMNISEGNGINSPAGWRTSDGKLWFPMIQGGIVIEPDNENSVAIPTYIDDVSLAGVKQQPTDQLEIADGDDSLEIKYTGVSFGHPEQIQFHYKLEGFDKDWQEVGTRRVAYYPYLPPGTYTFVVETLNGTSAANSNVAKLNVVVRGPFWRTTVFYWMLMVLLAGLITLAYQFRLRKLELRRQQQQEFSRQLINAHEAERKRIATEIHDGIGHTLLIIRNWIALALKKSEGARKELSEADTLTAKVLDETKTIAADLRPLHFQTFGLTSSLEDIVESVRESTELAVAAEIDNVDDLFNPDQQLSIFRIFQECFNNILKHARAKSVVVTLKRTGRSVSLTIVDDGVGFTSPLHDSRADKGEHLGLNSIRHRTELLGGTCVFKSVAEKGTTVRIDLPEQAEIK